MKTVWKWMFAWVVCAAIPSTVAAQVCAGFASFERGPIALSAGASFNDNAKVFGGSVAFGGSSAFGQLNLGAIDFDDFDESAFNVGGGAGYQVVLDQQRTFHLCPFAGVGFVMGPKNIAGSGIDYSETDFEAGIALAAIASRTSEVQVVPSASLAFANANAKLKDASGSSVSDSESFGLLGLGVGFVFSRQFTFKPSVSIPFGLEGASTSFGVTVAVTFGSR